MGRYGLFKENRSQTVRNTRARQAATMAYQNNNNWGNFKNFNYNQREVLAQNVRAQNGNNWDGFKIAHPWDPYQQPANYQQPSSQPHSYFTPCQQQQPSPSTQYQPLPSQPGQPNVSSPPVRPLPRINANEYASSHAFAQYVDVAKKDLPKIGVIGENQTDSQRRRAG